jgi:hypothetical protein
LDIKSEDGVNNNNARAQLYHCTGAREQKFSFAFAGSSGGQNLFYITTTGNNKCLQVRGGGSADGTQVDQFTCGPQPEQRWWLQSMGDGSYALHSLVGGCLDVSGGSSNDGTKIQKWTCNGTAAQRWRGGSGNPHACTDAYTTPQTAPFCRYDHLTRSVHARTNESLCVAAPEGQAAQNGVQLFQGKCVYSDKFWTFRYLGLFNNTVYYAMQNSNGGLCLGATGGNSPAPVRASRCDGAFSTQFWSVLPTADPNFVTLRNYLGLCLDVVFNTTSAGAAIDQAPCNGSIGQQFRLDGPEVVHGGG